MLGSQSSYWDIDFSSAYSDIAIGIKDTFVLGVRERGEAISRSTVGISVISPDSITVISA